MKKRIFTILFIVLMVVMGGASIATYYFAHRIKAILDREESANIPIVQSYKEIYPFSSGCSDVPDTTIKYESQALADFLQVVNHAKAGFEIYTKDENPLGASLLRIPVWYDEVVQKDIILTVAGVIIRLSNGYYTFPFPYSRPKDSWKNLKDFADWLKLRDIKFFHLISADKGDDSFGTFPEGVPGGYSLMAQEYRQFLDENGIDYLDAKPKLLAQNSDFYYWFYKADHHWNVHAGLLMAEESAKKLRESGVDADIDVVIPDKFTLRNYPNSFLGSLGRAMGPKHTEDLEVYYPKGETCFHIQILNHGLDRCGSIENTLIESRDLSSKKSSYRAFLHGDSPLVRIENANSNNGTRVLVIKQSKADVMCPYLALAVRYLDVIDPRYFDGSIRTFIEKTKPDAVIVCIDVPYEGTEEAWELQ